MKKIEVKPNQTVFDISLEQYGTCEAVGEILKNNPEMINDDKGKIASGIDPIKDKSFYLDLAIRPGFKISIDPDSRWIKKHILREIQTDITTSDNGTDN